MLLYHFGIFDFNICHIIAIDLQITEFIYEKLNDGYIVREKKLKFFVYYFFVSRVFFKQQNV